MAHPSTAGSRPLRLAALNPDDYAIEPELVARIMTPALIIYMAKVEQNVARMLAYMNGDPGRWRPHLKTTKTPEVYAALVKAGVRAFKCATLREARCMLEVLHREAITDAALLIAYPHQGPALEGAAGLARAFPRTRLSILSESPEHARHISPALGVFVDVNPGMNRTGIPLDEPDAILAVANAAAERFDGLHFYDGHIHQPDAAARRTAAHANYQQLLALIGNLTAAGKPCREVVTSGTPSFRYALEFPGFAAGRIEAGGGGCRHRVSPGTVVFHDYQYDELLEDLALEPAAMVLSRVISHPTQTTATCDAGSKSVAAEAGDPVAYVLGHPGLVARSPSEEHLPLEQVGPGTRPARGEPLLLIPRHICPTVNLAEQALLVAADGSTKVVSVSARAHDLMLHNA